MSKEKKEKKVKEEDVNTKTIGGELPPDDDEKTIGGELPKDDDE